MNKAINIAQLSVFFFIDECSLNNGGCSNHCSVVPEEELSVHALEGLQLGRDNKTCEIVDYCRQSSKGSQACEQHKQTVKCSCYEGWKLDDGESCTSVGKQMYILLFKNSKWCVFVLCILLYLRMDIEKKYPKTTQIITNGFD